MANILPKEKQAVAISALCEGSSIRSIERMTGIHRDTIMRLGIRVGEACAHLHDQTMRELPCAQIQIDEMWGFIGKKQRDTAPEEEALGLGDVWAFVAIDPDTKLVPSYLCGKRDMSNTMKFVEDVASRMKNRIQLFSDGANAYIPAVHEAFGAEVDYAQIVKEFAVPLEETETERKYSPVKPTNIRYKAVVGRPDPDHMTTAHVERSNLTTRMHVRRLTRLTNAFSKKLENFRAAVALHFAYYNFVKTHTTLRMTPAMAAGVAKDYWKVEDLLKI